MTTIAEENRKHLRKSVLVECFFRETDTEPTSITPSGDVLDLETVANLDMNLVATVVMDLGGSGFMNDGRAVPMRTDTDSFRYGYISEEAAKSDGTFDTPFGVTIAAADEWDAVTFEVMGQYGNKKVLHFAPTWSGGSATIYLDEWTPGERAYIIGVYLGMAWVWDDDSLLGVNLDLRSVNTEIGGELEASSIDIQAYEPTDYTDVIGRIEKESPIWYHAGYPGEMSELRKFYLSEAMSWDDNVLTVRGQDATMLLDNVEIPVDCDNYASGWYADHVIGKRIRRALASITFDEVGSPPNIEMQGLQVVLYDAKAARSIISEYTGFFRNESYFRATYVDAGRPTLTFGDVGKKWTIYADEIADFDTIVEIKKKTLQIVLPEYYLQHNDEIAQVKTTSGKTYFVNIDPPSPYNNIWITPTPTSSEEINCSRFKFKAAASTTYTIYGYQTMSDLQNANNPYKLIGSGVGEVYKFDFEMPLFLKADTGSSITKLSMPRLRNRSNIMYEFTYRGNPHIQPRDILNVEVAKWVDELVTIDGLYPADELYPSSDLYPYGTYRTGRKMIKTWETMTVDTVTLEHSEGGGLTSKVRARKGAV